MYIIRSFELPFLNLIFRYNRLIMPANKMRIQFILDGLRVAPKVVAPKVVARKVRVRCRICSKVFVGRSNLKKHVKQIHEAAPKSCVCGICGKAFHGNWALRTHQKNIHHEEGEFACLYCAPTTFSSPGHRTRHMREQHGHTA